jgi:hypothetical protein
MGLKPAVELGGGGTEIGPLGTFGLDLEYQVVDRLSIRAGASAWVLFSPLLGQMYMSSNLNLHYGVVVGF